MEYNNESIRRQDRVFPEAEAMELLNKGEYGILSMVSENNSGYGIPLSYVFEEDKIYFHCALEGEKLRNLQKNNQVSFCVIGPTHVLSNLFTTAYSTVIVKGTASTGLSDAEKMHALELILDKYSPNDKVVGLKHAEKSLNRTEIIRLDILTISGKRRNRSK